MAGIPGSVAAPRARRKMLGAGALWLAAAASGMLAYPAWAQQATATGEVRRVDVQQGTVALRHGEIKDLDLPAATLVYRAAPALLKDIKPGDKVRFTATRQEGKYMVTAIDKTLMP